MRIRFAGYLSVVAALAVAVPLVAAQDNVARPGGTLGGPPPVADQGPVPGCITEGFDNAVAPVFTTVDEFDQAAAHIFRDHGTWPSVRFVIRRQEAG